MRGLALAGLIALLPGLAVAELGVPRLAKCLLVVQGTELIRGPCNFTPLDEQGSFSINGLNGKYFADVLIDRPGVGEGYWNGTPYSKHAHSPLGLLYREDGCWVNKTASVCAW